MYTIGQIANIMGISRDKLRYYEEKGILAPAQNDENNYRQYTFNDIDTVLSIEFYRSLDLDFKTIEKLHRQSNIKDIENILNKKLDDVVREISRLNAIADRIGKAKNGCVDIEKYLYKYTIRPMAPIKILGEISDFRAYDEFEVIHENRKKLAEGSIIKSLKRYITFNDQGIVATKMLITKEADRDDTEDECDILEYEKCLYTIVEDGPNYLGVMEDTFKRYIEWIHANNYRHKGIVILGMLFTEYTKGVEKSYLEVYAPIE